MFNPRFSELLTAKQAAEYAGVHQATIRRALTTRQMRGRQIDGKGTWVTTKAAVDEHFKTKNKSWLDIQKRHEHAAKIRANFHCQKCNSPRPHYWLLAYYLDRDHTNFAPSNLFVLCFPCYNFATRVYHPNQMILPSLDLPDWLKGG